MKHLVKAASLALAATTATVSFTAPAAAQQVKGMAYADLEAAARLSTAYTTAQQQRQTTYAAQIQQAQAARQADPACSRWPTSSTPPVRPPRPIRPSCRPSMVRSSRSSSRAKRI